MILGLVAAGTVWLALDGNHYWHDIRFLYASAQFSMHEIVFGAFNPHQIGGDIDEISAGGFYLAKVLHIWGLQRMFTWIAPSEGGFTVAVYVSVVMMGVSALISYQIFVMLFKRKHQAWLAGCCFVVLPITAYLAGKLLSEVTALFFMTISIWTLGPLLDVKNCKLGKAVMSGMFLGLAALARLDIVLCFVGLFAALLLTRQEAEDRIAILKTGAVCSVVFLVIYVGTIYRLGTEWDALIRYFRSFTGAGMKSSLMSITGILTFGGVVYAVAVGAIFSRERKRALFLAIWFLLSSGPAILITWNYMVEPRYLVAGLLPLAGLGALGLEVLSEKVAREHFKEIVVAGIMMAIVVCNSITVRFMPYELDRRAMVGAVNDILEIDRGSAILIPWSYTDFHFLQVMMSNVSIYNVNSTSHNGKPVRVNRSWQERLKKWYGNTYISSAAELQPLLEAGPVYYLGWEKYPPAENAKGLAKVLGLQTLADLIDGLPLKNHLAESWLWHSPSYQLKRIGKSGQYEYFKVLRSMNANAYISSSDTMGYCRWDVFSPACLTLRL